jgi:hypothetical protein
MVDLASDVEEDTLLGVKSTVHFGSPTQVTSLAKDCLILDTGDVLRDLGSCPWLITCNRVDIST